MPSARSPLNAPPGMAFNTVEARAWPAATTEDQEMP